MRALLIEDNPRQATLVEQGLRTHGFHADCVSRLADADAALLCAHYDAVVLDLQLPDGDGMNWLTSKRKTPDFPPVLILSARNGLKDRLEGLDRGADDYLAKPADCGEIAARLRALLRRPGPRAAPVLRVGTVAFDPAAQVAKVDGAVLDLTRKEGELLELLMRHKNAVVRRSTIANSLYALDEETTPNAIEALVSRLRHKLQRSGGSVLVTTVRGLGYMMKDPGR